MREKQEKIRKISFGDIPQIIRSAGITGAGGAGFPSYMKWKDLSEIRYFLVNLQESEPILYSDKWLVRENPEKYAALFDFLLDSFFDVIVVGTKEKYREDWLSGLVSETGAVVYLPDDLPFDVEGESGVVIACTRDVYDHSEEYSLIKVTTGEIISPDLPTEHGWITHNTETVYNIYKALFDGEPVTKKYVHVNGNTPYHRCLEVPIGTPAMDLLKAAGVDPQDLKEEETILQGGPGWCAETGQNIHNFSVTKRTNAIILINERIAKDYKMEYEQERINLLRARDWKDRQHETEPSKLEPDYVRIPLISNSSYENTVKPSQPVVVPGDEVEKGEVIAIPHSDGVSIPQHASITGEVTNVTDTHVKIRRS